MFKSVQAIFYFVNDVVTAAQWYSQLLDLPVKYFYVDNEIRGASIDINGVEIFFHFTDEMLGVLENAGQVAKGACG
ncbi:hypothetical protein RIVM261_078990 [Rivularia sp. IAM M-261]|nr:hypothetical protein RIVM261_078990 [Rivularia sp. IAM M-261]